MLMLAAALAVVPPTPDWMGSIYETRPDTKLTQVVIPGTHDSGAFKIDTEGKCKVVPIAGATFQRVWDANRNVLVLYAKGQLPKNDCYRQRERVLYSPWPNTEDPAASASANLGYLTTRKSALAGQGSCSVSGGNQCGLFVDQLQLSMALTTQVPCFTGGSTAGCSLLDLARTRNPTVVQEMTDWKSQGLPVNISIVDFYELDDTATGQIALNVAE